MKAVVKWFDSSKGFGTLITDDNREFFVHQTSILMEGYRFLEAGDIVDFEIGTGNNGQTQAVNVSPVITRQMIRNALKEKNLKIRAVKSRHQKTKFIAVDANDENNIVQLEEKGMSLQELATFAGIDLKEISE